MASPVLVITDRLDQIMAPPREVESTFQVLMEHLYDRRYTGQVTFHFKDGVAKCAELPSPKIKLT